MPSTHNMRNPDSTKFKLRYSVTLKLDQLIKNITMTHFEKTAYCFVVNRNNKSTIICMTKCELNIATTLSHTT